MNGRALNQGSASTAASMVVSTAASMVVSMAASMVVSMAVSVSRIYFQLCSTPGRIRRCLPLQFSLEDAT